MFPPQVEQWRPLISELAGDLPVEFLLAWIARESDGNDCSWTRYHECGLFQLMPPDNTNVGGTTEEALRAACVYGTQQHARAFTDDESRANIAAQLVYVNWCRERAHEKLSAAGVDWDESTTSFWKFVKLQHAYPAPTQHWLELATASLGRAPTSWDEFAPTVPTNFSGVMANADAVGSYGSARNADLKVLLGLSAIALLLSRLPFFH